MFADKEWFEVLTKRDLLHVLNGTRHELILDGFRRNVAAGDCQECRSIARRLNAKAKKTGIKIVGV